MDKSISQLDWINDQQANMVNLLQAWADINSGSANLQGLSTMLKALQKEFAPLGDTTNCIKLPSRTVIDDRGNASTIPSGEALHVVKRQKASKKVLLCGHMDTVYGSDHPFQKTELISSNVMRGPGVADMKGGLVIMLIALTALEQHPAAKNLGWEVAINPDEEIGSVGSEKFLLECALRNAIGLVFEPAFSDGALVGERKGSANFTLVVRGKSAHAGRDFDKGRNAITALSNFIVKAEQIVHKEKGVTINFGYISGGGPVNIVPDLAMCKFNIRATHQDAFMKVRGLLENLVKASEVDGITIKLYEQSQRPPKSFDDKSKMLFNQLNLCARKEGYELAHRPSGGVCDGNILAVVGLPVIDTLGVIGGEIHTPEEFVFLDSLASRARLVARFLINYAEGHFNE